MAKKKASLTLDTSDPRSLSPGYALPPPINPFAADPAEETGLDAQRLPMPVTRAPAPAPSLNLATKGETSAARSQPILNYAAPVAAGLSAGGQVQPTTDSGSAVLQTAQSTLGGAASGALAGAAIGAAGGPIGAVGGAVAGGLTALVSGGIQAFTGLKEARANKRAEEKQAAYIKKWNEDERAYNRKQDELNRSGTNEQLRYNRRQNALASQWKAFQSTMDILNQNMDKDENLRKMFLTGGR